MVFDLAYFYRKGFENFIDCWNVSKEPFLKRHF